MVSYIQPADVAAVIGFKEDGNMNEKNTKAVGWFFMILGIAYLINPFDVPGPIDDVLAMSAGTILKIVFDMASKSAVKKISKRKVVESDTEEGYRS